MNPGGSSQSVASAVDREGDEALREGSDGKLLFGSTAKFQTLSERRLCQYYSVQIQSFDSHQLFVRLSLVL
jgi:hypothetical protein